MRIPLDRESKTHLYQQIKIYLRHGILTGSLAADTRLPASRQLAHDLGINRITVENAYAELEAEGFVYSRVGSGTYVLTPNDLPSIPGDRVGTTWPLWQQSELTRSENSSEVTPDRMLMASGHDHPISFASGNSDARLFPAEDFRKVLQYSHIHRVVVYKNK